MIEKPSTGELAGHPGSGASRPRPLWAPWRIEYIRSEKDDGCFICELAGGQAPESDEMVVARGTSCFIIMNAFPYNSGHVLVAPYRHVADLADIDRECQAEILAMSLRIKRVMTRLLKPDGFNFGFNFGAAAGAGLAEHIHGHLVPRWFGDTNFMPVLGGVRVMPEALRATAALLREGWEMEATATKETTGL